MKVWTVTPDTDDHTKGTICGPLFEARVALGKNGIVSETDMAEGDGATPLGRYPFRRVFYRPDMHAKPASQLSVSAITPSMGWCDDPEDKKYNQLVALPFGRSHEKLWRDDDLYNVVIVIGHNDAPVVTGKGSAVFMHVARDGYAPTLGCIAMAEKDIVRFVRIIGQDDFVEIKRPS